MIFQPIYKHIGVACQTHTKMGRVTVIDYGAQILSFKAFDEMQTPSATFEETKVSALAAQEVDWKDLAKKIAEEINSVRANPKHLTKQMERSLTCFDKVKILRVKGRETRVMQEGAAAYIEALEFVETQKPVKKMTISKNLTKSAEDHINDLIESGEDSQIGSDGSRPNERMQRYTRIDTTWSESIIFGG